MHRPKARVFEIDDSLDLQSHWVHDDVMLGEIHMAENVRIVFGWWVPHLVIYLSHDTTRRDDGTRWSADFARC